MEGAEKRKVRREMSLAWSYPFPDPATEALTQKPVRRERTLHACFVTLCRDAPCPRRDVRICEGTSGTKGKSRVVSTRTNIRRPAFDNAALAERVREEIARRHMSRQALAAGARISLSTLEKALSGRRPFTLASIVRLEEVLGVSLRAAAGGIAGANGSGTAPDELGNYGRAAVAWLEGAFLTLRPSLGERGAIYSYRTEVMWDDACSCLTFREKDRVDSDFSQFGTVSVPQQSGHIYFVTNRHGQHRLIVLARPVITGEMYGLITTLQAGRGSHLSPVAMPIVLQPIKQDAKPSYGRISRGHAAFTRYSALLGKTVADDFATLLGF